MGFKTQRDVDRLSLPLGVADRFFFDDQCQGLSARLQGAKRSWVVHYTVDGKRRRLSIGDIAALSLADARKRAGQVVSGGRDGADPLQARAVRAKQTADTVGGLITLYLVGHAERKQKPRTLAETKRALGAHLAPLHGVAISALNRRTVTARLIEVADSSGPIMANRCRAHLSHCFTWAIQTGLAEINPVVGTVRPAQEVRRDRVLSSDELRAVWLASGDDTFGRIVKLLILTGQRCREIGDMRWAEIDRDRALFILPATRSKNGRANEVPLAPAALALLPNAKEGVIAGGLVFGRPSSKAGFSGWTKAKRRLDKGCGVKGWTLHDLRRTAVTGMAELGVAPHIIETIVNHVSGFRGGVAGTYNHAQYRAEKATALQRWAAHVEAVVAPATAKRP